MPITDSSTSYRAAVWAGYLGWTLDSFDYFLLVFCLTAVGKEFHKSDAEVALAITLTLALRPIGALLFGLLSDRYGRRIPLMLNLVFYSIVELLTGLAPNFTVFLVLRALFGIGMGGEWGVSASLVMEHVPKRLRGVVSGVLQQGFAAGNILAATLYFFLFDRLGWRPLFFIGGLPALLAIYVRYRVKESPVWEKTERQDWGVLSRQLMAHWKLFVYITCFMAMMSFAGHGTGDMYPTFLQRQWQFGARERAAITAFSNVGAIVGAIVAGYLSDRWGRRRTVVVAVVLAAATIPIWAYAPSVPLLIAGAFAMQFTMQGAWGVIPAYLAEISPNSIRGSLPGFGYQCGALISSSVVYIEALLAQSMSYSAAMATTAAVCFAVLLVVALVGKEYSQQKLAIDSATIE